MLVVCWEDDDVGEQVALPAAVVTLETFSGRGSEGRLGRPYPPSLAHFSLPDTPAAQNGQEIPGRQRWRRTIGISEWTPTLQRTVTHLWCGRLLLTFFFLSVGRIFVWKVSTIEQSLSSCAPRLTLCRNSNHDCQHQMGVNVSCDQHEQTISIEQATLRLCSHAGLDQTKGL